MKKSTTLWALVAVAAAVGGGTWWRARSAQPAADAAAGAASAPRPAQTVTVFTVQQKDVPVTIEATGTVVPLNTVELRPQVSTTVRSIAIREGQFVKKGDLLFSFDDRADQANAEKARATLLRDRATLADLERQWKRSQELRAQNFISQGAADTVLAQVEAQRALVVADEAAVRAADVSTSYGSLRAPLSGRTGAIAVNPGSLVQPSGAALVTISQMDPINVSFQIPEAQLGALLRGGEEGKGAKGAGVSVLLPPSGPGRNAPRESLNGTVSFIDNAVDVTSGTIKVKGEVPNPKQLLWPGQYVTVKMTLRTLKDASVVPQAALIIRGQERQVYVVNAKGEAEMRPVQQRFNAGEFVAVEGVSPGEQVVVDGKQNLRPGTPVKVAAAKAGKGASGAAGGASGAASGGANDAAASAATAASGASR